MELKKLPATVGQHAQADTSGCIPCHGNDAHSAKPHGEGGGIGCGEGCHGTSASHVVHTSSADARGPDIGCADCHGASPTDYTKFADAQNLANTNVCDACHSPGGTFNGIDSQATTTGPSVGAKDNWSMETTSLVYNGAGTALRSGKEKWCVGCHDTSGAIVKGQTASNKGGNNSSYGYFATGHGKTSSFARMSWQDTAASSNSAANRACTRCHDTDAGAGQVFNQTQVFQYQLFFNTRVLRFTEFVPGI